MVVETRPAGDRSEKLNLIGLEKSDYKGRPSTLCQGCGHDSISSQIINVAFELSLPPHKIIKMSGIGCSSKSPAYFLNRSHGFNALHGRMPSVVTGAWVAQEAAKRHCPVTLELGGKGAQVIFADADLDAALPVVVNAIVQNAGQTCSAGSRLLVERSRYEEVLKRLGERFAALTVGPALADLDCGPLIRATQLERVNGFLADAQRDGIATVAQGTIAADAPTRGYYVAPRLLRDVAPQSRIACEEVFGPVLVAMPFVDEADAIGLANGTDYGLVTGVWTNDGGRQLRLAHAIRSGQVFINSYGAGGGVELPFGGVKHSGYGREKGFEALYGFTTLKTVVLRHG